MTKNNPLFVDSTRLHGSNINTRIELTGLVCYEHEKAFLRLKTKGGEIQIYPLERNEEGAYFCRVSLLHQQEISYQFYVVDADKVVVATPLKNGYASYMIVEPWEPVEGDIEFAHEVAESKEKDSKKPPIEELFTPRSLIGTLIDKWGL